MLLQRKTILKPNLGDVCVISFKQFLKAAKTAFSIDVNGLWPSALVFIAVSSQVESENISTKHCLTKRPTPKENLFTASTLKFA